MKTQGKITVIIPIRNEEKYISALFSSIENQDFPSGNIEILFIDGGSSDSSVIELEKIIENKENKYHNLKIIENPNKFVPFGLNKAIREASFDTIIRLDAHATYQTSYLSDIVFWKNKLNADNVGGIVNSKSETKTGKAISDVMSSKFGMGNTTFRVSNKSATPSKADTVPFGIYSKKMLNQIGYFDERFIRHQDYELNYRIRKNGGEIFLIPSIEISYYVRETFKSLYIQFKGYGYYKGKFLRMYKKGLKIRHLVPVLLSLSLLIGIISIIISPEFFKLISFAIFILPYLSFIIIAALILYLKTNRCFFKYILIFPIIHITWGINVLRGFLGKPFPVKKFF